MTRMADQLGTGESFTRVRPVSARRQAIANATGVATEGVPDPTELPVKLISQNPDNPRDHLHDLDGITQTIEELGVINAITIARASAYLDARPERAGDLDADTQYVVIDGHRRLEGARRANLTTIKVLVDDALVATDEKLLEAAFVANSQRENMTALEEAHALKTLVAFYGSQTKAARRLGMSQGAISSSLSLLEITPELQAGLARGELQKEHVRNLRRVSPAEQKAVVEERKAKSDKANAQKRRRTPGEAPAAAEETEAPDYHGVIIPAAETAPTAGPPAPPAQETPPEAPADTVLPVPVPAGEQTPGAGAGIPPAGPGPRQIKMPWDDGLAVAELAIRKMTREQRRRLLARLEAEERTEADGTAAVPAVV